MIPKNILEGLTRPPLPIVDRPVGGQQCGTITSASITISHQVIGFSITIDAYRSQVKNYNLALLLFELYLIETKII